MRNFFIGSIAVSFFLLFSVHIISPVQADEITNQLEEFDYANGLFSRGMYDMAIQAYHDFSTKYPEIFV